MALSQELLSLGLNNKESEVYLAALKLGYCSVQEIAKKANMNRTTVYTHIKNLISRGLMSAVEKAGKVFYLVERPEKLKYIQEQQEKEVARRKNILQKIMPELESIYNVAKNRPSVRYFSYENPQELAQVRKEIQELRADEMLNIFNYDLYKDYIDKKHIEKILDMVGEFKALYISPGKILDSRLHDFLEHEKFNIKFLSETRFDFLNEILIGDKQVYIAGRGDWLIINDRLFAQTLSLLFHALWGIAEEF